MPEDAAVPVCRVALVAALGDRLLAGELVPLPGAEEAEEVRRPTDQR